MSRMLFIHHSGLIGGAGVSLRNNLTCFAEAGHEITLYAPSDPPAFLAMVRQSVSSVQLQTYGRRIGAITYYSGGDSVFSLRFWYRALLILKQWRYWNRTINRENPDVVIVNSTILCWMSLLGALRPRKSVCFVRETKQGAPKSLFNRLIHLCLERFTQVVFISKYDEAVESLKKAKSAVVYNYVDARQLDCSLFRLDAERKLGLAPGVFRVLYVGGVSYMKGFDVAMEAVLQCSARIELLVAGMGIKEAQNATSKSLRNYAHQMEKHLEANSSGRIIMLGTQKNMSACYAACDVLLFPMRSPHQARPAFEAGFFAKPVIITEFKNIKEFVEDGENGFLVPPDTPKAIAEKLELLEKNPDLARRMGQANHERCMLKHDGEKNRKAVQAIVEKVAVL